jgi:hypothetical protein
VTPLGGLGGSTQTHPFLYLGKTSLTFGVLLYRGDEHPVSPTNVPLSAGCVHESRTELAARQQAFAAGVAPRGAGGRIDELVHRLVSHDCKTAEAVISRGLAQKA